MLGIKVEGLPPAAFGRFGSYKNRGDASVVVCFEESPFRGELNNVDVCFCCFIFPLCGFVKTEAFFVFTSSFLVFQRDPAESLLREFFSCEFLEELTQSHFCFPRERSSDRRDCVGLMSDVKCSTS